MTRTPYTPGARQAKAEIPANSIEGLKAIVAAARSWHKFHHGSSRVACDEICKALPIAEANMESLLALSVPASLPAEGPEDSVNLCARKDCRHDLRIHTWEGKPEFSACKDCDCHEFLPSALCVCTASHSEHSFTQPWPYGHCERTGCANFVPASLPAEGVALPTDAERSLANDWITCAVEPERPDYVNRRAEVVELFAQGFAAQRVVLAALSESAALRKKLEEVRWLYECDKCYWIANPEHLGKPCRCGGTCKRVPISEDGERAIVYWSNKYEAQRQRAETAEAKLKENV